MQSTTNFANLFFWSFVSFSIFSFSAHASECDPLSVLVKTTPIPPQSGRLMARWLDLKRKIPANPDFVLLGDSLFEQMPMDKFEASFPGTVWNFSLGFDQTQNALWRLSEVPLPAHSPQKVFVLFGTNDMGGKDPSSCAIAEGIKSIVTRVRTAWPSTQINVVSTPPAGVAFNFSDALRLEEIAIVERWVGEQANMRYIRLDDLSITCGQYNKSVQTDKKCALPDNSCTNYKPDRTHFTPTGYDTIIKALKSNGTSSRLPKK